MSTDYSEDRLIQNSAADLLENELGWTSVYAYDRETLGENGTLGRTSYHEVLLAGRFRKALVRLNPWITDKQMAEAVERMTEHMSSQTLMQINEQKYQYIREGIPVTRVKPDGTTEEIRAKVIDFDVVEQNDFLCVREFWVYGALYRRRADIVGFVNGIPLLFIELKNHDVEVENAFHQNYREIPNGNSFMSGSVCMKWIAEILNCPPCYVVSVRKRTSSTCWKTTCFMIIRMGKQ